MSEFLCFETMQLIIICLFNPDLVLLIFLYLRHIQVIQKASSHERYYE